MNCKKCGNLLSDGTTFCPNCGTKVEFSTTNNFTNNNIINNNIDNQANSNFNNSNNINNNNNKKPKCFVIGIISIIISFLFGFLGIVTSIIGLVIANKEEKQGIDVKTGRILNIVSLILAIFIGIGTNLIVYFNIFGNGEFEGDGYTIKYNSNWHSAKLENGTEVIAYKFTDTYIMPYTMTELSTSSCDIKVSECQNVMAGIIELYLHNSFGSNVEINKEGSFQILKDNIYCQSYTIEIANEDFDSLFYLLVDGDTNAVTSFAVKVVDVDMSQIKDSSYELLKNIEFK